jgi:hypothetical protein
MRTRRRTNEIDAAFQPSDLKEIFRAPTTTATAAAGATIHPTAPSMPPLKNQTKPVVKSAATSQKRGKSGQFSSTSIKEDRRSGRARRRKRRIHELMGKLAGLPTYARARVLAEAAATDFEVEFQLDRWLARHPVIAARSGEVAAAVNERAIVAARLAKTLGDLDSEMRARLEEPGGAVTVLQTLIPSMAEQIGEAFKDVV